MKSSVTCPFMFNSDYLLFIIIIIKFGITGCYNNLIQLSGGAGVGSWYGSSIRGWNSHLRGKFLGFKRSD